ncbi:MAG: DNA-directed RNA polymerase specialized sigma subunit [Roseivirga sp.]|jgi:DNA-directed RNA polymerase specialized sigma subunit
MNNCSESDEEWRKLQKDERSTFIKKALNALNEEDAIVITLFYLNENSLQEISEITNWEI